MITKPKTVPELRFLFSSANGATYRSLGQRPRYRTTPKPQALKGRPNSKRMEVTS
jgi:hypothetical protein